MQKIRVLIVDDSAVVRRILTDVLAADPAIEVVGTAANGRIALTRIAELKPDAVTLDVEMPELDGLETLTQLRPLYPRLPVIMCSTLTEQGAAVAIEALSRGANDYIAKPTKTSNIAEAHAQIRDQLLPKLKAHCLRAVPSAPPFRAASAAPAASSRPLRTPQPASGKVEILAIGVSTGGPNALNLLLPLLPANLPVPIVIVQHMPPLFTRYLAERLAKKSRIRVSEATEGAVLRPGEAWIAPGDFHMELRKDRQGMQIHLQQGPQENSCRPAVDVLFRSVAAHYGASAMGVVLTGMGQDGLVGCQAIRQRGGRVWAQDQETSVVWGMPGAVVKAELAERILPLERFASEISAVVAFDRGRRPSSTSAASVSATTGTSAASAAPASPR